jgi:hypothetical protein
MQEIAAKYEARQMLIKEREMKIKEAKEQRQMNRMR